PLGGASRAGAPPAQIDGAARLAALADQVGLSRIGQTEEGNDRTPAARRRGRGGAHVARVASPGAPCPAPVCCSRDGSTTSADSTLVTRCGAEYAWRPWTT